MKRAFQVHPSDNVATLLQDATSEMVEIVGALFPLKITLREPIALGHKVALREIVMKEQIVKFGVAIAIVIQPIARGAWVHLHNCRSALDERSSKLDLITGAATDTPYD